MPILLDRIPIDLIERFWPHIEPLLRAACNAVTTSETPDQLKAEALDDRLGLWVVMETDNPFPFLAAGAACIRQTNRGPVAVIRVIAGRDGRKWIGAALREFETHAKAAGAVKVEIEGRQGWSRVLRDYRVSRVVMEKEL